MLLAQTGRIKEALPHLDAAARLLPEDAAARTNLANALRLSGDLRRAIDEAREAVRLDGEDPDYPFNLGVILRDAGDIPGAIEAFEEAARRAPTDGTSQFELGRTLFRAERFEEATQAFGRVHGLPPDAPVVVLRAAAERLHAMAGSHGDILRGAAASASAEELFAVAILEHERGRLAASATLFARALSHDPLPQLLADHRSVAAQVAARAGTGAGTDASTTDGFARAAHRRNAITWLRAALADAQARRTAATDARAWLENKSFAKIREEPAIASFPDEEQESLRAFWEEVRAIAGPSR
jgi:tetratricopeptide (TPR) repeat protein